MKNSIFEMMQQEDLTTLKIRYDYKTHVFRYFAAREWEEDLNFAEYNKSFILDGLYTEHAEYFNSTQTEALFQRTGLTDYLELIKARLSNGNHFGMDFYYFKKYDVRFIMHQHSRKRGIFNKSHAIMAGGIRRHLPETPEFEVIKDGLNLARGMSYKNIAADIPAGGCKATVQMNALDLENLEIMGFLAYALDVCRDMTAPDMNLPVEMSDIMHSEHYSYQYTGGRDSKTGLTGKATAYGLVLTMKEAVRFTEGNDSLKGKRITLIGLGAVGKPVAQFLLQEGAKLTLAVRDLEKGRRFIQDHGYRNVSLITDRQACNTETDILCPCAVGGVITRENIPTLKCRYIWGAANNQLKANGPEEELELAKLLERRGILFQPEWWHNCAGIMCGAEEYYHDGTMDSLTKRIEKVLPQNTRQMLEYAASKGITPTEACYEHCNQMLFS